MKRNKFFKIGFAFCLGVLICVSLFLRCGFAQDVRVEAQVNSQKVALGSALQFSVTVYGGTNIAPIQLPDIKGFHAQYMGPSTRVSIINGKHLSSKAFTYSLFPQKTGKFQIPAISVTVSSQAYNTQPIMIEVVGSATQVALSLQGQPTTLKDKIFVVLKVPKREVYLNERLPIKILLFISDFPARDIQYPELDHVGFSMDEYEQPRQYQQVVKGVRYNIVEFNTEIYPTREGRLLLGPAKVECNLLVKSAAQSSRFGSRGGVFDDDFFNSLFDRHQKQHVALESKSTTINVLPLPQEGKPDNFSGAVGRFDFNVSVSPTELKEGDPITLRMTVLGKGNLKAFQVPALPIGSGFKLYDPQVFEKDDIKKTEQVIIPQSDQITEVPAIQFSYFDPSLKKYRITTKGPFPIKITALEKGEEFKIVGLDGEVRPIAPEAFGQDIVFIKSNFGKLRIAGQHVYNSILFYVVMFLAAAVWLSVLMHYKRTHRMKTDIGYARRLQAPRQAKQGLAQAKKFIADDKKKEFYDTVFKTIQQYLGNKFHLSLGAVTFEAVQAHLSAKNIEQKVIDSIKLTFEECDMIRYASADINRESMEVSYQRLTRIIDHLERFLK